MKITNPIKTIRLLSNFAGLGLALFLYGCVTKPPVPPVTRDTYDLNRPPVEAPASVKASDFRLSPPEVLDITVQKWKGGQARVAVQFAADPRLGTVVTAGDLMLHDDGRDGEVTTGNHIYSAILPLDVDALVADQQLILSALAKKHETIKLHHFHGRDIINEQGINLKQVLSGLHPVNVSLTNIIHFPPFGLGWMTVDPFRSLTITDTNVVDDPTRTFDPCTGTGTPMGKWTFGYLMTQMANQPVTGIDPADLVTNWLQNWLADQSVNGFPVRSRPAMQQVIDAWPKQPNGKLDLGHAPFKLMAIVNRIDLAGNTSYGQASGAEGRFVFSYQDCGVPLVGGCGSNLFTTILEYGVPIQTCNGLKSWANQWLSLSAQTLGSPAYNAALEAITSQFTGANLVPTKPNRSALDQLRTDELMLGCDWQLREFHLLAADGQLHEATLAQTPDRGSYDWAIFPNASGANNLGAWINQNSAAVEANAYSVPAMMPSPPAPVSLQPLAFLGGETTNRLDIWNAPGIIETNRHNFSLNTCNACHGNETATLFLQIAPAGAGSASLSGFLTGITQTVPVNNLPDTQGGNGQWNNPIYMYNDLERRQQVLYERANTPCFIQIRNPVVLMAH